MRNFLRTRRGSQALEFALALPIFVTIVSGTVDFGWYLHLKHQVVHASGQGARAAAAEPSDGQARADVASTVTQDAWTGSTGAGVLNVTASETGTFPNRMITVTATVDFTEARLVGFLPTPGAVEHTTVMRIEDQL